MTEFVVRKSLSRDKADYRFSRTVRARSKRLFQVAGYEMQVEVTSRNRNNMPEAVKNDGAEVVWFLEEGLDAAVVSVNVHVPENDDLWVWVVAATSEAMLDKVSEMMKGEAIGPDSESDDEDEDEDEEDHDDDEDEPSWSTDDIVRLNSSDELIVKLYGDGKKKRWKAVRPNGKFMEVDNDDIGESADSDEARDAIIEAFGLYNARLGDPDFTIARYNGILVKINDVDGEEFAIDIDGDNINIGEDGLMPGHISLADVHQVGDHVEVPLKNGDETLSGTVSGLWSDDTYEIDFDESVLPIGMDNVSNP